MSRYTCIEDYASGSADLSLRLLDIEIRELAGARRREWWAGIDRWAAEERQTAERERVATQTAQERLHLAVARIEWEVSP